MALAAGETLVALTAGETPAYQPIQSAAVPLPLRGLGECFPYLQQRPNFFINLA